MSADDFTNEKLPDFSSISIHGQFDTDFGGPAYRDLPSNMAGLDSMRPNTGSLGMQGNSFAAFGQPEVYRSIETGDFREDSFGYDSSLSAFGAKDGFRAFGGPKHDFDPSGISHAIAHHRAAPEPPEVPGGYLEPSYHFMIQSQPTTVFHSLIGYFHLNQIDFVVKQDKFKLKCVSYKHGGRLPFVVRIFSVGETSKQYAVEFQRRSGDIMQFSDIYRSCKSHLEQEGYTAVTSSKSVRMATLPPLDVQATVDQSRVTMKCLVQMAGSDCADVKAKAVEALTEMTCERDEKIQQMIVADGGLGCLLESLDSTYEDVHRSAVSGVANLTKERISACRLAMDSAPSLYKLASSETAQVVRETARALENIGCALGKDVVDLKFRQTLDILTYCKDPLAQGYANRLVQTLGI